MCPQLPHRSGTRKQINESDRNKFQMPRPPWELLATDGKWFEWILGRQIQEGRWDGIDASTQEFEGAIYRPFQPGGPDRPASRPEVFA